MSNDAAEYRLIVQANNLAVEIDNEVMVVHKVSRRINLLFLKKCISVISAAETWWLENF